MTIKLPEGAGYAAITEAALVNYAGMGFQADGLRGFNARLGHALPVSHPFDLRYGKDEARRLSVPASIAGTITTPWRVLMIGQDLNTLVNCDIIGSVSPPPDRNYFPAGLNTEWVKPGRCVWKYLDGGENTLDGMKEFSRLAGELGCLLRGLLRRLLPGLLSGSHVTGRRLLSLLCCLLRLARGCARDQTQRHRGQGRPSPDSHRVPSPVCFAGD